MTPAVKWVYKFTLFRCYGILVNAFYFAKSVMVVDMTHGSAIVRRQSIVDRLTQASSASWPECFGIRIVCYNLLITWLI